MAATALCAVVLGPGCAPLAAFLSSAFVAGVQSGKLGVALRAGAVAAAQVIAFDFIGQELQVNFGGRSPAFGTPGYIVKVASHAGVGCLSAMASGGKCGQGAAGAAAGAAASPFVPSGPLGVVGSGAVGGLAAVASGGRFADGAAHAFADAAATAAFGYMYNACGGPNGCMQWGAWLGSGFGAAAGLAGSAACDVASSGACIPVNPNIVAASTAAGGALGAAIGAGIDAYVHGNSSKSPRETEVYYLMNRATSEIDKIGITSNPGGRYSQSQLEGWNVRYETQTTYSSRYPAMVDENIRLTWYRLNHGGSLPRLNCCTR